MIHRLLTEVTGTRQALKHDKTLSALPKPSSPLLADNKKQTYAKLGLQLLDLLDTLFLRTGSVYGVNTASYSVDSVDSVSNMWHICWCPLLEVSTCIMIFIYTTTRNVPQGIARMCCDARYSIRQLAVSYLQRALLGHTLHNLEKNDWEACFLEVII